MSIGGEPAAALDLRGLLATLQAHEVDYTVIAALLADAPGE